MVRAAQAAPTIQQFQSRGAVEAGGELVFVFFVGILFLSWQHEAFFDMILRQDCSYTSPGAVYAYQDTQFSQ